MFQPDVAACRRVERHRRSAGSRRRLPRGESAVEGQADGHRRVELGQRRCAACRTSQVAEKSPMDAVPQQQQVRRICLRAGLPFSRPCHHPNSTSPNVQPCLPIGPLLHNDTFSHSLYPPRPSAA
jgi:hypothetical protein